MIKDNFQFSDKPEWMVGSDYAHFYKEDICAHNAHFTFIFDADGNAKVIHRKGSYDTPSNIEIHDLDIEIKNICIRVDGLGLDTYSIDDINEAVDNMIKEFKDYYL
jgi:hypothetical protein